MPASHTVSTSDQSTELKTLKLVFNMQLQACKMILVSCLLWVSFLRSWMACNYVCRQCTHAYKLQCMDWLTKFPFGENWCCFYAERRRRRSSYRYENENSVFPKNNNHPGFFFLERQKRGFSFRGGGLLMWGISLFFAPNFPRNLSGRCHRIGTIRTCMLDMNRHGAITKRRMTTNETASYRKYNGESPGWNRRIAVKNTENCQ